MLVAEIPLHRTATVGAFFCWNDDVGRLLFHSAYCRRDRRRPLAAFPGLWRFDSIRFVVFARGRNNRIWRWGNNLCVGLARRHGVRRRLCCRCGCACGEFGRGGGVEGRGSCQGVPLGTGPLDPVLSGFGPATEGGVGESGPARVLVAFPIRRAPFVCRTGFDRLRANGRRRHSWFLPSREGREGGSGVLQFRRSAAGRYPVPVSWGARAGA